MKVLVITSRYPSQNNPYNHMFVHMRCVEMIRQGVDLEVFVPSNQNKNYVFEGVKVRMLPSKEIVKNLSVDKILYLHLLNIYPLSNANGWVIYKYILKHNLPFAMYVHGNEVQKFSSRMFDFSLNIDTFLKWFKKDLLVIPKMKRFLSETKGRSNSAYVFPSLWMKKELESNLKLRLKKYHIIPNGIDTDLFKFHYGFNKRYNMLTLRPLSSNKYAVDIAIEVVKYMPKNYTLTIYGKGKYQKKYEKQIRENNLEDRIFIKNKFIDRSELNDVFSNYGVFLSPTRMDAQGVSMCEAMASGLLTVSNDNTAIPEFLTHGINGILGKSPKEMADRIYKVCNDEYIYSKLTKNGRDSMEQIDIKKTVEKEISILSLLDK